MSSSLGSVARHRMPPGAFATLLRVQLRLSMRERYLYAGIGLPIGLLVVFWFIGKKVGGTVAGTGLTILDLWVPTILVICYMTLALIGLPATFARDREIGWLRRVSTTPIPPSWLLAAQLLLNLFVATAVTVIVVGMSDLLFGAPLSVGLEFVGAAALAIVEIYSLGLIVAAIAPSQQAAGYIAGGLLYPLMFFAGLWIQPVQVGGLLEQIMWYSPTGAASRVLLYTVFNVTPPYETLAAMAVYAVVFVLVAIRTFRWE